MRKKKSTQGDNPNKGQGKTTRQEILRCHPSPFAHIPSSESSSSQQHQHAVLPRFPGRRGDAGLGAWIPGCSQGIADGIALLRSFVVLVHRTTGGGDSSRGSSAQGLRAQEETTTVQHAVRRRRRANREGNHAVLRRRAGESVL